MADKRDILIVLVGDPAHTAARHDTLRPIVKGLKAHLKELAGTAYNPQFRYAAAPLGPGPGTGHLEAEIRKALQKERPHVMVPIASAATRAAKAVVDADCPADRIPIVFTVVSEPKKEGFIDEVPRITGVSRSLVKTAPDAVERLADMLGRPCHVYCCFRPGLSQAERAWNEINTRRPADVTLHREDIKGNDCRDFVQSVKSIPPKVNSQRTGIFMIPDDLVGRCAPDVIKAAHGGGIPTFFQQLEWVCPGKNAAGPPFAPGGYGVTADWMGKETADKVHPVILGPDPDAATTPPRYPREDELQFLVNEKVAGGLGLNIPPGAIPCQPTPPVEGPPSRAAITALPKAAPTRGAKKPAKKRPAPKRRATGKGKRAKRTAKGKKRAAPGRRMARRGARRGRRT